MNAKRGFTQLVLLVVMATAIIGGAAYYYSKTSSNAETQGDIALQENTAVTTPDTALSSTSASSNAIVNTSVPVNTGVTTKPATNDNALDLAQAKSAFISCRTAFKEGDKEGLRNCLSKDNLTSFQREGEDNYIRMWQGSFEGCGGWDRQIVEVLNHQRNYPNKTSSLQAYIYFSPTGGCQNYLEMVKENGQWKFAER